VLGGSPWGGTTGGWPGCSCKTVTTSELPGVVTGGAVPLLLTVTVMVAVAVPPCPSLIVYVNLSVPMKPGAGV